MKFVQVEIGKNILPLGASYLIFQCVGSLVDLSKNLISSPKNFFQYVASLSFFPTISAGPITNTMETYHQVEAKNEISYKDFRYFVLMIFVGFCKKTIADLLYLQVDDLRTDFPDERLMAWIDIIALVARFYADFSGYSDIAIGSAGLLGIKVPTNFRTPFLARSVAEFWQRWHMSLTAWTTKYLFYPLLFWLKGLQIEISPRVMTGLSTLVTMIFIGLWHGFSFNYLVWGIYFGTLILLSPSIRQVTIKLGIRTSWFVDLILTFFLVCIGQIFAGTQSLEQAFELISVATVFPDFPSTYDYESFVTLGLVVVALVGPHFVDHLVISKKDKMVAPFVWEVTVAVLIFFVIVIGNPSAPFQYVNF